MEDKIDSVEKKEPEKIAESINSVQEVDKSDTGQAIIQFKEKPWQTYIFEFFMLFLAVFCGFFAEYKLEDLLEKDMERNYIVSMVDDLKRDTFNFRRSIEDGQQAMFMMDSLIKLLKSPQRNSHTSTMYYLARRITQKIVPYEIFDRTYSQMKSSGNLRVLHSPEIATYISGYYFDITLLASQQNYINNLQLEYINNVAVVFDAAIFHKMYTDAGLTVTNTFDARDFPSRILPPEDNPPLANESKAAIDNLIGTLHYLYARMLSTNSNIRNQNDGAIKLMRLLQVAYRLE